MRRSRSRGARKFDPAISDIISVCGNLASLSVRYNTIVSLKGFAAGADCRDLITAMLKHDRGFRAQMNEYFCIVTINSHGMDARYFG